MKRCNAVSITLGTRCSLVTTIDSNYCNTHQRILKGKSPEEYELIVLENSQDREIQELKHEYQTKLEYETSESRRKQLQKEIEENLKKLKKEHIWGTFKHWLARHERKRRAMGGEFTNI
jgi:hypothetical protein